MSVPPGFRSCWWVWTGRTEQFHVKHRKPHITNWKLLRQEDDMLNKPVQTALRQWWTSNPSLLGRSPESTSRSWNIHCPEKTTQQIQPNVFQNSCNLKIKVTQGVYLTICGNKMWHSQQTPCPGEWSASAASSCRKAEWRKLWKTNRNVRIYKRPQFALIALKTFMQKFS